MKTEIYTTSLKAWDSMMKSIEKAEKSVYIEMYIFENDTKISHDFLGLLSRKAREGLHVIIVADSYGSPNLKKIGAEIISNGIDLVLFSHWLRRIHRKIVIIDEKIAFIGGVNIGKRFTSWNDLQIRLHGKIAKKLLQSFSYTYEMAGGRNADILNYRHRKLTYKLKYWLVEHWPRRNIHSLRRHYTTKINDSKKSIRISTPYFAPPRWLISLLDSAAARGVEIDILIPLKSDLPFMDRVNYLYMEKLYPLGIKFHLAKHMNHSKLLLIDDQEALIGSQNLDPFSFNINMEAGVFFREKELVTKIVKTYNTWKMDSQNFNLGQNHKRLIDYILIVIMKVFKPIL